MKLLLIPICLCLPSLALAQSLAGKATASSTPPRAHYSYNVSGARKAIKATTNASEARKSVSSINGRPAQAVIKRHVSAPHFTFNK